LSQLDAHADSQVICIFFFFVTFLYFFLYFFGIVADTATVLTITR